MAIKDISKSAWHVVVEALLWDLWGCNVILHSLHQPCSCLAGCTCRPVESQGLQKGVVVSLRSETHSDALSEPWLHWPLAWRKVTGVAAYIGKPKSTLTWAKSGIPCSSATETKWESGTLKYSCHGKNTSLLFDNQLGSCSFSLQ